MSATRSRPAYMLTAAIRGQDVNRYMWVRILVHMHKCGIAIVQTETWLFRVCILQEYEGGKGGGVAYITDSRLNASLETEDAETGGFP